MRLPLFPVIFAAAFLASASGTEGARAAGAFTAFDDTGFAFVHAILLSGHGDVKRDWTVVVRDGLIIEVGPSAAVRLAPGTKIVDATGDSLVPGLVGMHEHLYAELGDNVSTSPTMLVSAPRLYLAAGVTTARTTGSLETYSELELKKRIDAGAEPGPTLDVTGPYLSGPAEPLITQYASLRSPEDATQTVDFWTDRGVTSFKAFLALTRAELGATIQEAHRRGVLVTGHLCSVTMGEAADIGIDQLEHGIVQSSDFVTDKQPDVCPAFRALFESYSALQESDPRIEALISRLVAHHVAVTSTLAVLERDFGLAPPLDAGELALLDSTAREGYDRHAARPRMPAARASHIMDVEMSFERRFVAAGGLLTAGADSGVGTLPGFADERTLELLAKAGFSPREVVTIATLNGAKAMRRADRIGSIETGKDADLVLLHGDVSADVASFRHVAVVVKRGVAYDPQKLLASVQGMYGRE